MAWEKLTRRYVEMRVWKLLERIDFWRQLWLFGLWQMGAWDSASQWAAEEIGNLSEIIGMKESDVSWRKSNCDSLCFNYLVGCVIQKKKTFFWRCDIIRKHAVSSFFFHYTYTLKNLCTKHLHFFPLPLNSVWLSLVV